MSVPGEVKFSKAVYTRPRSLVDVKSHFCRGATTVRSTRSSPSASTGTVSARRRSGRVRRVLRLPVRLHRRGRGRVPPRARPRGCDRVKRAQPDKFVFTYQGDGDLAAIGRRRSSTRRIAGNLSVIFVNNTTYGMTGGQMAPTTLLGQKTSTTPYGRDFRGDATRSGWPSSWPASRDGILRPGRGFDPRPDTEGEGIGPEGVRDADRRDGSLDRRIPLHLSDELGMKPLDAQKRVLGEMSEYFPLGVYKERKQADFA